MYQIKRGDEVLWEMPKKSIYKFHELIFGLIDAIKKSNLDIRHLLLAAKCENYQIPEGELMAFHLNPIAAKYGLTITKE